MICDCGTPMLRKCTESHCTWVCGECGYTEDTPDLLPSIDAWEIKVEE